jgi:kynurenine formamidase
MKIIDLTLAYKNGMRGVGIRPAKTIEENGWNASTLTLYSHAGTHMDAPQHFNVDNQTIDQLPLENCIGKAWMVDITPCEKNRLISVQDLHNIAERFTEGDSLIIKTGWSHYLGLPEYRDALPRISKELARWCVDHKVKMLAVEPPSVADVNNLEELTEIHHILLKGGVTIVEGLSNLGSINQDYVQLYAIPLKIHQGDGAPARVFAILEEKTKSV